MTALIVAPYYNNSHFLPLQVHSFDKHIKDMDWRLLVLDDSTESTLNALTNQKETLPEMCKIHPKILYEKIPAAIHKGGNGVQRHQNIINFFFGSLLAKYKEDYSVLLFFDADMVFTADVFFERLLDGCEIAGPRRKQWLGVRQCASEFKAFYFLFVHCILFDLTKITNLETIDMSSVPRSTCDTGSMIKKFIIDNPTYKVKYHEFSTGCESIDGIGSEFFYDKLVMHFGSGSLWSGATASKEYERRFAIFSRITYTDLLPSDKLLIDRCREAKWLKKQNDHIHHPSAYCSDQEFLDFVRR